MIITIAAILKRPRTPPTNNPAMDYQTADSEHLKRMRTGPSDEARNKIKSLEFSKFVPGYSLAFFNSGPIYFLVL